MFDTTGAICAQSDPEMFFPENFQSPYETHAILRMCSNCPVFKQCREYSLKHDVYGWWAGLTRAERKKIQQERGITPVSLRIPSFDDLDITTDKSRRVS